jgi:hypothetical protein
MYFFGENREVTMQPGNNICTTVRGRSRAENARQLRQLASKSPPLEHGHGCAYNSTATEVPHH